MRKSIINFEDVKGEKYNFLTVIKEDVPHYNGKYNSRRWVFKCDCGVEKSISPSNVFNGTIKSCGCKKKEVVLEKIKIYYDHKYEFPIEGRLYSNYAKTWNKSKREFKISKELFIKLVNSNCYYCGREPFLIRGNKKKTKTKPLNGIDRIDSSIGYLDNNVVPCCWDCNRAKMDRSLEDFLKWVKIIYENIYK